MRWRGLATRKRKTRKKRRLIGCLNKTAMDLYVQYKIVNIEHKIDSWSGIYMPGK